MTLFLSKLLPMFVYPLGLALVFGVLVFIFIRRWRLARALLAPAIALVWIASMPAFANLLETKWIGQYAPITAEDLPRADAIVLLGGLVSPALSPRIEPELNASADRLFRAARLFHMGKAPVIVVSGGNLPWRSGSVPEAAMIAGLLAELGVPEEAIVLEPKSRNTRENAINTAELLEIRDWRTVLLVTSGSHMRRAMTSFARAGIAANPASSDIRGRFPYADSLLDFLPDAEALTRTTIVIREVIGLLVYRLRDWA